MKLLFRRQIVFVLACQHLATIGGSVKANDGQPETLSDVPRIAPVIVKISDGSVLIGTIPEDSAIQLRCSLGELQVPVRLLNSIRPQQEEQSMRLEFRNGDILSGSWKLDSFNLEMAFGSVSVPINLISTVQFRAPTGGHLVGPFVASSGRYQIVENGNFEFGDLRGWNHTPRGRVGAFVVAKDPTGVHGWTGKAVTATRDTSRFGYVYARPSLSREVVITS